MTSHTTMVVLSLQWLLTRVTGMRLPLPRLRQFPPEGVRALVPFPEQVQAVERSLTVVRCLEQEGRTIEDRGREAGRTQPGSARLPTVPGIGPIVAGTMLLAAGDMRRIATGGPVTSSCRCVGSEHLSNDPGKGGGHTKNGKQPLTHGQAV